MRRKAAEEGRPAQEYPEILSTDRSRGLPFFSGFDKGGGYGDVMGLDRRNFLVSAAAAGAAACSRHRESPWRALSKEQAATLEAWCECLIPEDADPGAKGARVVCYLDTQLDGRYKRHRKTYGRAIAALEQLAQQKHGQNFAALPFAVRTAVLSEFESGENQAAFRLILDHALQGYYGNPRHGGNAGFVSWRMLGVAPLPVRGRLAYTIGDAASKQERS